MFLLSDVRHLGNALRKVAKAVVERHSPTACIDLVSSIRLLDPCDEVLDEALVELVEDVGRDR